MDAGSWRKCSNSCGRCSVDCRNSDLKRKKPDRMLEWAHSVIDVAEDIAYDRLGIPKSYNFNCNITASAVDVILPRNVGDYLGSRKYHNDVVRNAVNEIYRCFCTYNENRTVLNKDTGTQFTLLVQEDIDDFKHCMQNQVWFSVVHAAIDEINITRSPMSDRCV